MTTKYCPIKSLIEFHEAGPNIECHDSCAWWVSDWDRKVNPPVDKGWCAVREIASLLNGLRVVTYPAEY